MTRKKQFAWKITILSITLQFVFPLSHHDVYFLSTTKWYWGEKKASTQFFFVVNFSRSASWIMADGCSIVIYFIYYSLKASQKKENSMWTNDRFNWKKKIWNVFSPGKFIGSSVGDFHNSQNEFVHITNWNRFAVMKKSIYLPTQKK